MVRKSEMRRIKVPLPHPCPLICAGASPCSSSPLPPLPPCRRHLPCVSSSVSPQHQPHLVVAPRCRSHCRHHRNSGSDAAIGGRWPQRVLLKVVLGADRVQDGGERLLAERTLCLVVRPLLDAWETEAVQTAVQVCQVVEAVQADGALGVW